MANNSIDLVSLDFFALKNSFRNYLRDNKQFKDYDFEGSNINLLLDLLSYNTHKNAFFLNMLMSESFLDSAQLRTSVLSHAKELNYVPRSSRSSRARIKVTFDATAESSPYNLPKGSPFTTLIKDGAYVFTLPESITVASSNNTFTFETDIYEGVYVRDTYVFQDTEEVQRFKLTNRNADTRSISVTVTEDNAEIGDTYKLATTLLDLNSTSKVYFLQTNETGGYEVLFGDDVLGKRPKTGAVITIEYRISAGTRANGARLFSVDFDPTATDELLNTPQVELIESSTEGEDEESIESIRYYAPRHFQTQERTITSSDYAIALKTQFPEINTVYAYGGEEVNPPQFGRVFVAVDISNVDGFPDSKKREYYNFIKRKCPFSIEPVFVEPEFSYLSVNATVRYDVNLTGLSVDSIKSATVNEIISYRDDNLDDFAVTFRNSKLACLIDELDLSIISSSIDVQLYKKYDLLLNQRQDLVINFDTELIDNIPEKEDVHPASDIHAFVSSPFIYNNQTCVFEDNGSGKIRLMKTDGTINTKITDVGTIDYKTGQVILDDIVVNSFIGNFVKFYVRPKDLDISTRTNTILTIESDEIHVTVEPIRAS